MSIVIEKILCLDTNIFIKSLTPDERDAPAVQLIQSSFLVEVQLVAPAFAWVEFGSVLRKKIRANIFTINVADRIWQEFSHLPIDYINTEDLCNRAWEISQTYQLPTLYDAAFLACTEVTLTSDRVTREFWTADQVLLRSLGNTKPSYIRELGIDPIIQNF